MLSIRKTFTSSTTTGPEHTERSRCDLARRRLPLPDQGDRRRRPGGLPGGVRSFEGEAATRRSPVDRANNDGDNYGSGSFLAKSELWNLSGDRLLRRLATLPSYRFLVVMMEQCNAGGFNAPVLAASTASVTSIASAATRRRVLDASPDGQLGFVRARRAIAAKLGISRMAARWLQIRIQMAMGS